jgi:hypothetical protein
MKNKSIKFNPVKGIIDKSLYLKKLKYLGLTVEEYAL